MPKQASRVALFELRERYLKLCSWLRRLRETSKSLDATTVKPAEKSAADEASELWLKRFKRQLPPLD